MKRPVKNMDAFFFHKRNVIVHCFTYSYYCGNPYFLSFSITLFKVSLVGLYIIRKMFLYVPSVGVGQFMQDMLI